MQAIYQNENEKKVSKKAGILDFNIFVGRIGIDVQKKNILVDLKLENQEFVSTEKLLAVLKREFWGKMMSQQKWQNSSSQNKISGP